jgi:hypothetical protein
MADDIPSTKKDVRFKSEEVKENDWNEKTFFPFQEGRERHQVRIDHHAAAFPKLGIGALVGALTLMALSGGILLIIQGPGKVVSDWTVHVYKTHRYVTIPKPAAWLSGILSGISVCFHIALSEGLNVAWWYHVRQENATVRNLHDIWGHGTSTWTVVKSGAKDFKNGVVGLGKRAVNRNAETQSFSKHKSFSYVALATLFVATIPLNGFLLQNAVIVKLEPTTKNATVLVPMLNGVGFGNVFQVYATGSKSGGGVSSWSSSLGSLSQIVTSKIDASVDLGSFNTTCLGSCKTTVEGMGFQIQCEDSVESYDIPVLQGEDDLQKPEFAGMEVNGTNVLDIAITYNYLNASRVKIRSMWKDSAACKGNYSVQTCNLDLATVEYPVTLNSGIQEATQSGLRNTTIMTLGLNLLNESPKVVSLAPNENDYTTADSVFAVAGLAGLFAQTLNSSINIRYDPNEAHYGTVVSAQGLFAQQFATSGTLTAAFPSCNGTIGNATQQALAIIQSMMFQMGAYNWLSSFGNSSDGANLPSMPSNESVADFVTKNTPQPMALHSYQRNEYRVVWAWFFGAMSVTLAVSIFILPTFWGYWRLERKTTMSPFETARAFHAPVLYQDDSTIVSKDLIKRVGNVQIHRDLPNVPNGESSGARRTGESG